MGKIHLNHDHNPIWLQKSHHKRQEQVCRLKTRIRQCPWFGRAFLSYNYVAYDSRLPLQEDGTHPFPSLSWCDIYMPSPARNDILYNITLITLTDEYNEEVWSRVWDAKDKYLADTGQKYRRWHTGPFGPPKAQHFEMKNNADELDFGGLTMDEFIDLKRAEILKNNDIELHEKWQVDTIYRYGVGLTIYANVKNLDTPTIISVMGKFFTRYEGLFLRDGVKAFEDKESVLDKNDLGAFTPGIPIA